MLAGDNGLVAIGNGQAGTGPTSGDITVQSGGSIVLSATGTGFARIATGGATDSNIDVTAAGNITLSTAPDSDGTTTGSIVEIGNFQTFTGTAGGDISVTSTGGTIALNAAENQSLVQIGNGGQTMPGDATGDIVLSAGNLTLGASGTGAFAQIGNGDSSGTGTGNASGDIAITVAGTTTITASPTSGTAWIGNLADPGFVESGNVALTTGTVTNTDVFGGSDTLGAMTVADLGSASVPGSGGNVTLDFTNPKNHKLSTQLGTSQLLYTSPNTLSITMAGTLTDDVSLLNSGLGTARAGDDRLRQHRPRCGACRQAPSRSTRRKASTATARASSRPIC